MPKVNRLDKVVWVREREEERARRDVAAANQELTLASATLVQAVNEARRDERSRGTVHEWDLVESAHARSLLDRREAERAVSAAQEKMGASQERYQTARAKAEVLRRLAEARRQEARLESSRAEQKLEDELALLRFTRP